MKTFAVRFIDETNKQRFDDEYGFGTNPPAFFVKESMGSLRWYLNRILEPGISILEIVEAP